MAGVNVRPQAHNAHTLKGCVRSVRFVRLRRGGCGTLVGTTQFVRFVRFVRLTGEGDAAADAAGCGMTAPADRRQIT
jgi:hypothetical protein